MNTSPVNRIRQFLMAMVFTLLFSGLLATPAFADGETPPAPDTGTTETSTEGTVEETPAPTEEVISTEVAPTDEESQPTDPALTETATDPATIEGETGEPTPAEGEITDSDLLAELPEGTELVVLNSDGESVPLASEEAAEIVAFADPIWCPSGVAPNAGVGGCSISFATIADLFGGFVPTGNGTIWIVWGPASTGTAVLSPTGSWSGVGAYSLTVQGGWEGTAGSTALHTADPYSYFSDFLWIHTWVGAVTIKNVVFDGVSQTLASDFGALEVFTKGNIVLDKVRVDNSDNPSVIAFAHGAFLDNTSGTGNVTVSNSSFNNNEGIGLMIESKGVITLKNVRAYDNGASGANVVNDTATSKAVVVSNSEFSGNSFGLYVSSHGSITLNNISADLNNCCGAYLDNAAATIAAPVYVNGVNSFNGNSVDGLHVESDGLIKVSKTTANGNGGSGVWVSNRLSPLSVGVTISGFLNANNNGGRGLKIDSTGAVIAANLTTNSNGVLGTQIINDYFGSPKNVTISGTNFFNDNGSEGLEIRSRGAMTLYNLTANNNGYAGDYGGALLRNDYDAAKQMAVTLNGYNMFNDNSFSGLTVLSFGAVALNNVTAVDNGHGVEDVYGYGADIQNGGGTFAKAVAIKGINIFSGSDSIGLFVSSDGAISISKTTANVTMVPGCRWITPPRPSTQVSPSPAI